MEEMPWLSILGGSVSLEGQELAKIKKGDEWCFNVKRPYEEAEKNLAQVVCECLPGASGHFVLTGGGPVELLHAVRQGMQLTFIGFSSRGEVEAEITVRVGATNMPGAITEFFPFTVTGGVEFRERI
ncbi:MAG: hypothetical protein QME71_01750 [Dehalococcoidia bacterium]|nr:hypothetical protein [Dehalococcoidia bacterium]